MLCSSLLHARCLMHQLSFVYHPTYILVLRKFSISHQVYCLPFLVTRSAFFAQGLRPMEAKADGMTPRDDTLLGDSVNLVAEPFVTLADNDAIVSGMAIAWIRK